MDKLRKIFARVLDVDESEITDQISRENAENWDSFNHLLLITEIESEFKMCFTLNEVESIKKLQDMKHLLMDRGVRIDEL